jgi:DNA-binding transcriptional MerR regulator
MTPGQARQDAGAKLSIGALSRATGIPVETLRTWESRYGFPVPERKPSGHRVYSVASIPRLRRIAEALSRGHRAGQVVAASDDDLTELLAQALPPEPARPRDLEPLRAAADVPELLRHVEQFDGERLTRVFLGDAARLGPLELLETRVGPLIRAVGEAWEQGRLEIRHEHFLTERLGDLLRSLRLPLEERAAGPLVVLTSLPGESHALGLQMAALCLASAGCRALLLGTELPLHETARLVRDIGARALGLSVSSATRGTATNAQIRKLRELLPRRVTLLVGGAGAPAPRPGIEVVATLRDLDAWARRARQGALTPA